MRSTKQRTIILVADDSIIAMGEKSTLFILQSQDYLLAHRHRPPPMNQSRTLQSGVVVRSKKSAHKRPWAPFPLFRSPAPCAILMRVMQFGRQLPPAARFGQHSFLMIEANLALLFAYRSTSCFVVCTHRATDSVHRHRGANFTMRTATGGFS